MPVYADDSIPCELSKTEKIGFTRVVNVAPCAPEYRIHDGDIVREMTTEERAARYPENIIHQTQQQKRQAAYEAVCDPIIRTIEAYELEYALRPDRVYLAAQITMLRNEWDAAREAIRAQYPDGE